MKNRIRQMRIAQPRWDIVEAELRISVVPEIVTGSTEIRGRLMGPRCVFASTVEVSYPLRRLSRQAESSPELTSRVIIPEPNLWEPQCPFLYEGPIELWEEGECVDRRQVSHGLRLLQLEPRGLRLNGHTIALRGATRADLSDDEARKLRQDGYNTVVLPFSTSTAAGRAIADRIGLFVMTRGKVDSDTLGNTEGLSHHPSSLGWIIASRDLEKIEGHPLAAQGCTVIAAEVSEPPVPSLPSAVTAIACPARLLSDLIDSPLPRLVLRDPSDEAADGPQPSMSGIMGWVEGY